MNGRPDLAPTHRTGDVDVGLLPENGFGPVSPPWWGTVGFMLIEGFSLVVCLAAYLYLRRNFDSYPPHGLAHPALLVPGINLGLMLASLIVAQRVDRAAHAKDSRTIVRAGALLLAMGVAILVLRIFEFEALNVRWNTNAYGSAVWFTVGFHTLLLLIDFAESLAIWLIFATGREEEKHYGDAADDILYWKFIVASWVVVFAVIYLGPRVL